MDWLISSLESVESLSRKKVRLLIAVAGIIFTIAIWLFHLNYPSFLLSSRGFLSRIFSVFALVLILAPPFLTVVSIINLLNPGSDPNPDSVNGPLSGYLQKEKTERRRKTLLVAGIVSAANLLLIIMSSNVQE